MRAGYTADQIRAAEAPHLAAGEPLMARAAAALADAVLEQLQQRHAEPGRVLLIVGSGNNGGDALFAGATLATRGARVSILEVGSRTHAEGRAAAMAAGARTIEDAGAAAASADVIVDGILGTGAAASPALRGRAREVVSVILPVLSRPDAANVIAVDIPSGIDPDHGTVPDPTVLRADLTVTFGGYKAGLLRGAAVRLAGEVRLVDIGLAADLTDLEPAIVVE